MGSGVMGSGVMIYGVITVPDAEIIFATGVVAAQKPERAFAEVHQETTFGRTRRV